MGTNRLPAGLTTFLYKNELKAEIILWIFLMLSLLFFYLESEISSVLIGLSLTTLAIFYFLLSFIPPVENTLIRIVGGKVINIGSSVCIVGIMYKILNIPGANIMVAVGLISMTIATAIIVLTSLKNWNDKTTRLVLRVLLIAAFGLSF